MTGVVCGAVCGAACYGMVCMVCILLSECMWWYIYICIHRCRAHTV